MDDEMSYEELLRIEGAATRDPAIEGEAGTEEDTDAAS